MDWRDAQWHADDAKLRGPHGLERLLKGIAGMCEWDHRCQTVGCMVGEIPRKSRDFERRMVDHRVVFWVVP